MGAGGKDNLVILEMTGQDGTVTGPIQLNQLGEPKFRRGEKDVIPIEAVDIGLPVLIRLGRCDQCRHVTCNTARQI